MTADNALAKAYIERGVTFCAVGIDTLMLAQAAPCAGNNVQEVSSPATPRWKESNLPAISPERSLVTDRIFTTLTFFANGLGIGAWSVAIAGIKSSLHASDGQAGFALFAFGLGAVLAMTLAGFAAERIGPGKMCAICGAAFALCLTGPVLAVGLHSLAFALLLLGISNGSLDVVMNARASAVESAWQTPLMSSFHAAWSFGSLSGAAIAGLIAHFHNVRATLLIPAALVALLMIPAGRNAVRSNRAPTGKRAALAIPTRGMVGLGAIAFLSFLAEGGVESWTSIYLQGVPGISGGSYAYGIVAFLLSMSVCRFFGDRVVRRYGQRLVVLAGALLAAVAFFFFLFRPTLLTACAALMIVGIGLSNIIPIIFSAAGKRSTTPSQGIAMAATAGYAGFLIGPPVIGTIAELTSLPTALIALPLAALLVVPLAQRFITEPLPTQSS